MTASNLIFSLYPLPQEYLERLRGQIGGDAESLSVSTIPGPGKFTKLVYLGTLNADTVYVPIIEAEGNLASTFLKPLSLLIRARGRSVVEPDFHLTSFGWGEALLTGLTAGVFTIIAVFKLLSVWHRLGGLLRSPRAVAPKVGIQKVLCLQTNAPSGVPSGGAAAHMRGVIGALLKRGYAVDFFSAEKPAALQEYDALTFRQVPPPSRYYLLGEINHHLQNERVFEAGRSLVANDYGFIYQRLSLAGFAGVALSRLWGRPLVIEYNGSELTVQRLWSRRLTFERLTARVERACLRHAHLVVTVSDLLQEELIAKGVETRRIVCHPNGVDTDEFDPGRFSASDIAAARERLSIPKDAVLVTFVGTYGPWHGAEVLAHALRTMAEEEAERLERDNIHMLFVGDGARKAATEAIVAGPKTRTRCRFTGMVDPAGMPLIMAASNILASPQVWNPDGTRFFGSPTKLFEYLSSGRPLIASDLEQIGKVLTGCPTVTSLDETPAAPHPDQCGVLVEPGDADGLARAIWFLADNPEWCRAAGKNARRLALSSYTWEHHVAAILDGLSKAESES